ncbi:hypothetical protein ACQKM2_06640 [Streptomyces sp. NPDC004126]|uniref:hypothetical protein n=1 Tax=Streptomyces sp. NPDC004126 TaxID=3390695 RepID=UPI003CFD5B51
MSSPGPVQRVAALAAGVLSVVLVVCGTLFMYPMPEHGVPAQGGMPAAAVMSTHERASDGMDGDCPGSDMDCPLASVQGPATATVSFPVTGPGFVSTVSDEDSGPSRSARHLMSCRPRAPDLDSLCISRT